MKLKIKVKVLTEGCLPVVHPDGDWIDLRAAQDVHIDAPQSGTLQRVTVDGQRVCHRDITTPVVYIPLGVAIQLPKGFEAIIDSRSGGPKHFHMFIPNGQGVIDNTYCGDKDEWKMVASPLDTVDIQKLDRICQFRIQLSQKATMWQKLRWLFSSGVKIVKVDKLGNKNRNGLGHSGKR